MIMHARRKSTNSENDEAYNADAKETYTTETIADMICRLTQVFRDAHKKPCSSEEARLYVIGRNSLPASY